MTDDKILEAIAKAMYRYNNPVSALHETAWQLYTEQAQASLTAYRAVSDNAKDAARWRAYLQIEYGRRGQGQTFDKFRKDWNDHYDAMMGEPIDAAMAKESEGE